ncbi:MAG: glycogen synthase GlgA [Pseudomonadota bacterium]
MRVLFATSEVAPWSKTGGLADVSAGLPAALVTLGLEVTVVSPLYGAIDRGRWGLKHASGVMAFPVEVGEATYTAKVLAAPRAAGPTWWFVDNSDLFGRPGIYGEDGDDYPDNAVRFRFFADAVRRLAWLTGADLIHCNDWQTGLVPWLERRAVDRIPTVMTVHNLAFHGQFPASDGPRVGLPAADLTTAGPFEWGKLNFLKGGLLAADRLTTVSRGYAEEILTEEFGCGLDPILRSRAGVLAGITNGADLKEWSPEADEFLPATYSVADLSGKEACRRELLTVAGLEADPARPIIGMVGRLTEQKGLDLVVPAVDAMVEMGFDLVVLGTGQAEYELSLQAATIRHRGRVAAMIRYSNKLAHLIEAGADFFLMPSRFEPCGLNQMYSQLYGTPPVVHAVGGLVDTVTDAADGGEATGFKFQRYERRAMLDALGRALEIYGTPRTLAEMRRAGMRRDFSWTAPAKDYIDLYEMIQR